MKLRFSLVLLSKKIEVQVRKNWFYRRYYILRIRLLYISFPEIFVYEVHLQCRYFSSRWILLPRYFVYNIASVVQCIDAVSIGWLVCSEPLNSRSCEYLWQSLQTAARTSRIWLTLQYFDLPISPWLEQVRRPSLHKSQT